MFSKPNEIEVRYTCWRGNILFDLPFSVPTGINLRTGESILLEGFSPVTLQGYNSITQEKTLITFKETDILKVSHMTYNVNPKRNTWVRNVNLTLCDGTTGEPYI